MVQTRTRSSRTDSVSALDQVDAGAKSAGATAQHAGAKSTAQSAGAPTNMGKKNVRGRQGARGGRTQDAAAPGGKEKETAAHGVVVPGERPAAQRNRCRTRPAVEESPSFYVSIFQDI